MNTAEPCSNCEWTPSGFFAHPCPDHACTGCGHLAHDNEDGCPYPDPRTGWCDCEQATPDPHDLPLTRLL